MNIKKVNIQDKKIITECERLLREFLNSEKKYDENYIEQKEIKSLENDLSDDNNILLSCGDNNVLGFLFGYVENRKSFVSDVAHISFLYVREEHRNKKIATNLIDEFIKMVKKKNVHIIEVRAWNKNFVAKKMYENHGFNINWCNYRKNI